MTIDAVDQSANPWVVGMPDQLAATVFRYDKATRRRILESWDALGEEGRRDCRDHLAGSRLSWRRRARLREVILLLMTGGELHPAGAA